MNSSWSNIFDESLIIKYHNQISLQGIIHLPLYHINLRDSNRKEGSIERKNFKISNKGFIPKYMGTLDNFSTTNKLSLVCESSQNDVTKSLKFFKMLSSFTYSIFSSNFLNLEFLSHMIKDLHLVSINLDFPQEIREKGLCSFSQVMKRFPLKSLEFDFVILNSACSGGLLALSRTLKNSTNLTYLKITFISSKVMDILAISTLFRSLKYLLIIKTLIIRFFSS